MKEKNKIRRNNVTFSILGVVFWVVIISWAFHKGPFQQNPLNLQQQRCQQDSILFVKQIQQGIDSGFVFLVKTSGNVVGEFGPQSQLEDVAGNKIKPFTYYYYVKGHLIEKRWSMNRPESEFILTHNYQKTKMMVRRNVGSLNERLEVKVFDAKIAPSQIVME